MRKFTWEKMRLKWKSVPVHGYALIGNAKLSTQIQLGFIYFERIGAQLKLFMFMSRIFFFYGELSGMKSSVVIHYANDSNFLIALDHDLVNSTLIRRDFVNAVALVFTSGNVACNIMRWNWIQKNNTNRVLLQSFWCCVIGRSTSTHIAPMIS